MSEIQGMDTIPREIAEGEWGVEIRKWLPGWEVKGEYNYRPGAATKAVAAQLDLVMHNGSHPWINQQVSSLLDDLKKSTSLTDAQKTVRAAALVQDLFQ